MIYNTKPTEEQIEEFRETTFTMGIDYLADVCNRITKDKNYRPPIGTVFFDCIHLIEQQVEKDVDDYITDFATREQLTREEKCT